MMFNRKSILLIHVAFAAVFIAMTSCGGGKKPNSKNNDTVSVASLCAGESSLMFEIHMEQSQRRNAVHRLYGKLDIARSEFKFLGDTLLRIVLTDSSAISSDHTLPDQSVLIHIDLVAQQGKKLKAGVYPYMKFGESHYCRVSISVARSVFWFNWVSGMPEPGFVNLDYLSGNQVCGKVDLNVNKPDNRNIGTLRLKGNFTVRRDQNEAQ